MPLHGDGQDTICLLYTSGEMTKEFTVVEKTTEPATSDVTTGDQEVTTPDATTGDQEVSTPDSTTSDQEVSTPDSTTGDQETSTSETTAGAVSYTHIKNLERLVIKQKKEKKLL